MITAEQRETRKKYIGSSDAAAALGLSPWKSPKELWLEKTGRLEQDDSIGSKLVVQIGNALEKFILSATVEELHLSGLQTDVMQVHPNGVMAANFDGLAGGRIPVEAKYTESPERWGRASDGLDGLPPEYAPQILHELVVAGADQGFVSVYFGGRAREIRIYEIVPDKALLVGLEARLCEWWRKHVIGDLAPEQDQPCSMDTLSRIIRLPGKAVELDPGLVAHWRELDEAAKRYTKEVDAAKAKVIEALGDAEVGLSPLGTVSYKEQTRKEYMVPASTFRVCRFVAAKGGAA